MRFFLITSAKNSGTNNLFADSALRLKIELVTIFVDSERAFVLPPITASSKDAFYRASDSSQAQRVEQYLYSLGAKTFYNDYWTSFAGFDNVIGSTFMHESNHLPLPRTLYGMSTETTENDIESKLGGFPIIAKLSGGQHGVGVIRVDSYPSLRSLTDILRLRGEEFILREYIENAVHARLIVVGNRVIDSIAYKAPPEDFRTNVGEKPVVEQRMFSEKVNQLAVQAVKTLGLEFGGVDILVKDDESLYLLEVNYPCFFPRAQRLTDVKISDYMLEYLQAKTSTSSSAG